MLSLVKDRAVTVILAPFLTNRRLRHQEGNTDNGVQNDPQARVLQDIQGAASMEVKCDKIVTTATKIRQKCTQV